MAFDPNELEAALSRDITTARQRVESSAEQRGVPVTKDNMRGFGPRALRVRGKIVAQKEIAELDKTMTEVLQDLINTSQFRDKREEIQKRMEWENQFRELKTNLLTQGLEFEKMLGSTEADFQKRVAIGTAAGMALGGAARLAISGRRRPTGKEADTSVASYEEDFGYQDQVAYAGGELYGDPYRLSSTPEGLD